MKMKKIVATGSALALTAAVAVGGTLAWLQDQTKSITNTFTVGNVDITLTEEKFGGDGPALDAENVAQSQTYKVAPGTKVTKAADVTVKNGSEDCYLFVKVVKGNTFDTNFDAITMAEGWTALTGVDGVYWRTVAADADVKSFPVLKDDKLTVKTTATNTTIDGDTTLTFQAYAIQTDGLESENAAWTALGVQG